MTELLTLASRILRERGKSDWADQTAKLAYQYKERWERERKRGGDRDARREREPRHERERRHDGERREQDRRGASEHIERVMERVEKLEKRLSALTELMEKMLEERRRGR